MEMLDFERKFYPSEITSNYTHGGSTNRVKIARGRYLESGFPSVNSIIGYETKMLTEIEEKEIRTDDR